MKLPSKLFSYEESVLSKLPIALGLLRQESLSVGQLFTLMQGSVSDVSEFLDVLDCLYALKKIYYDSEKGTLSYVD